MDELKGCLWTLFVVAILFAAGLIPFAILMYGMQH